MKVEKSNVYVADLYLCTDIHSRLYGGFSDCMVGGTEYKGEPEERNVLVVKIPGKGYMLVRNLEGYIFKSLAIKTEPIFSMHPRICGETYVKNLKPYYINDDHPEVTKVNVDDLIKDTNTVTI